MLTILAGGTGSVKLVRGFNATNIICNVGDNIWLYGLYICPDIDTIMYGLAGILDAKGWGIKDDTFNFMNQLKSYGIDTWFTLGDKDLATHILRTSMIREGKPLSKVTSILADRLNVSARLIPATDDMLETFIDTDKGMMHLQEFWVKYRGELSVKNVIYRGIDKANALDDALDAISNSDAIVIAPANPITSINPIILLNAMAKTLKDAKDRCIAVSPIIGNEPISGPASKYMRALGYEVSPYGVAMLYSNFISKLIIDKRDEIYAKMIEDKFGIKVYTTDILMKDRKDEARLAEFIKSVI